jgi:hypothetical protein
MEYMDNASPVNVVSGGFGIEVITLDSDGEGQGSDQPCREITIMVEEAKDVKLGNTAVIAAAGVPLPDGVATIPLRLPVSNTNLLFFDGTAADKVYLIWRT